MAGLSNKDLKNFESTDLYCYNKLVNKFNLLNKTFPFSHAIIKEKSPMIWHQNANEPALLNCWPEGTQLWFEASVKKAQYHEHWLPSLLLPQFLHATSLFLIFHHYLLSPILLTSLGKQSKLSSETNVSINTAQSRCPTQTHHNLPSAGLFRTWMIPI